jgi:DNA-binding transcriptional MerR regulator
MGLIAPLREGQRRVYGPRERTRLRLILRGKRLGFSLDEIREIIDMYDVTGEAAQLRHFLDKVRQRRAQLRQQQDDIAAILGELDLIEGQCMDALGERRE